MEAIGTLAGGIAHDFNNILQPIIGYTEMVIANLPSKKAGREYLDEILAGTLRAKELVKQILTFSRQHRENRKPVETQAIVKEALKLIRASLPTTIEIRQSIDADCGSILADPVQIHQIIMNLCTNAYQAMEETGGTLEVKLSKVELAGERVSSADIGPGAYVCLEVSDSGPGIDRDVIERIFEPYFTTKEKGKGTGLGLAVVHGIVKNHDGEILVRSEPGRGTTFTVYFPLLKTSADPAHTAAAELPAGTGEHILLVDDERAIAVLGQRMLEHLGYRATISTSSPGDLPGTAEKIRAGYHRSDYAGNDRRSAVKETSGDTARYPHYSVHRIRCRDDQGKSGRSGYSSFSGQAGHHERPGPLRSAGPGRT